MTESVQDAGGAGFTVARGRGAPPTRRLLSLGALLLTAAGVALLLVNRAQPTALPPDKPIRDVPYLDGKWIRYSQGFAQRAGVAFAAPENGALLPLVHVTGTVTYDPNRVAAIGARIAGRVRTVNRLEGDQVKRGDVLAEIESAELGQAQTELLSARARADAAGANEKRERELAQAKISSHREAELAAAAAAVARAELLAAQGRVRAMGGTPNGEPGILLLQSPIEGKVVSRALSRGQFVEPTLTAFKVADLTQVFIELAAFERDVASIRVGDAVEVSAASGRAQPITGKVAHVGDEIDLETKTAPVRVVVAQQDTPLRPGQSVRATIHSSLKSEAALLLPRDAVTSVDGKPTVFVQHDALAVEPRGVELGRQDGSHVEIKTGLAAHERVAVAGVFALKSEIFR